MENKSGPVFCVRQLYFTKTCQQIWGSVNQPFIYFLYITSEEKEYYEALYLSYRPWTECSISQFFKTNCTQSIFGTINPGLFNSETVQKISKITYTASRFSFLTSAKLAVRVVLSVWMNINRVTLQHNKEHNKEFIMFIVLFNGFITFDTRGILSPPASDVHERLKTNGTAIKFAKEPDVCLFQRWTQNKKIAQSFLSTAKFITKYPSERFLSICGEQIYLKAF